MKQDVRQTCSIEVAANAVSGKWKSLIIYRLLEHKLLRFNELHRSIPDINRRMLTLQLRELEAHQIVHREVYAEVPPKVEYSLTPLGKKLQKMMEQFKCWGELYLQAKAKNEKGK